MANRIKLKEFYVGQLIARGTHPDPQIYTLAEIDRINICLAWWEGSHFCKQWTDYGDCYVPTIKQIEYSINNNGKLATLKDIPKDIP
jgi:hypothetical protein